MWYKLALWTFALEDVDAADRVEVTAFAAAKFVPRDNTIRAGLEDVVKSANGLYLLMKPGVEELGICER